LIKCCPLVPKSCNRFFIKVLFDHPERLAIQ